ncbi:MAG: hypothetical protein RL563_1122 [Pseudomonadota bacterium]|jgi:surfeit locus 1 family protein
MKIAFSNYQFRFTAVGLCVYLLLVSLLCSLGFWQLGRSEQKKQFLVQQQTALALPALIMNQVRVNDIDAMRYRQARLKGHYDTEHQFLLDNQINAGKSGYLVLTPFILEGGAGAVLVNRGWLPAMSDRAHLPEIGFQNTDQEIEGRINRFPSLGIKLQGVDIPGEGWPSRLQFVDIQRLNEKLGYALLDFQIELDAKAANGFLREWKIQTVISPEKHLGYAVQWFGLALVLTGLFIWISSQHRSEHAT